MRKLIAPATFVVASTVLLAAQQTPTFRSGVDVVPLTVTVLDRNHLEITPAQNPKNDVAGRIKRVLSEYDAGRYDVTAEVVAEHSLPALFDALVLEQRSWPADITPRERLVFASFALEVANRAPKLPPAQDRAGAEDVRRDVRERERLVAFAGAVLVGMRFNQARAADLSLTQLPDVVQGGAPSERAWFDAAFATLRSYWSAGLIKLPPGLPSQMTFPMVELARKRFPNDVNIALADAVASEHFGWAAGHAGPGLPLIAAKMPGSISLSAKLEERRNPVFFAEDGLRTLALQKYEKLFNTPVAHTARLRSGFLNLLLFQHQRARQQFAVVLSASALDPRQLFLANLFTGWSWDVEGNSTRAEASYRAALILRPNARSASVLMASVLARTDRLHEASDYAAKILLDPSDSNDPWSTYYFDGGVVWDEAVAALHATLRGTK